MHFDDRLATVLRLPAKSDAIARIQYRQLLDLLGTLPAEAYGPQVDAAYDRLSELSGSLRPEVRAGILHEPGIRLRSPRLVAMLAEGELPVASAAIAVARMDEEEWLDLIPALPVRARGFLRHRRPLSTRVEARLNQLGIIDRGLPPSRDVPVTAPIKQPDEVHARKAAPERREPEIASPGQDQGIGALVRKIEAFRRTRGETPPPGPAANAPRLPLDDDDYALQPSVASFDFASDAQGRICWAEPSVAPMVVGFLLGAHGQDTPIGCSRRLADTIRQRQPLSGERIAIDAAPSISGRWLVDAIPSFDETTGRFTGYSGRARRPATEASSAVTRGSHEADRMRQILHELRTPVGAIQMGAEMIQQQIYGPTPHEYRAIAAAIASDTARILAGFEELDRLVKLDTGALEIEPGHSDLARAVITIVSQLEAHTGPRKSGFALEMASEALPVGLDRIELDRLVWRLLAALAGAAAPSEILGLRCWQADGDAHLETALPASLAEVSDEQLFHARADSGTQALSAGMFGLGFTLRLAAAEAKCAGGRLERDGAMLRLSLPGLTEPSANLSQG